MRNGALGNEVGKGMGFDRCPGLIFNAEICELISLISDAARFIFPFKNLFQRLAGPDDNLVGLEVRLQFPARHYDCE